MNTAKPVDRRKYFASGGFTCESGRKLAEVRTCYETWGSLNAAGDNALLVAHALTGTSHAGDDQAGTDPGWWNDMIGPGKPFDPEQYFVICANVIGGCSGSTGPSSTDPETGQPYGTNFPVITIRDMVHVQKRLLDHLGVKMLQTVSGASMGGMQALEWAALYPEMVRSIIPIAAPGRVYPQSIAYRKAQRKAIMLDPDWCGGHYYGTSVPRGGLEVARMVGFISYRSEKEFTKRFGRLEADGERLSLDGRFEVEAYLEHHGRKLADWFDANSYLYLSKAMDLHDLGYGYASYDAGVQRITAAVLMIGFDSDLLFPCYQQREVVEILKETNPNAAYHEISTLYGHDAFLIEHAKLKQIISEFLGNLQQIQSSKGSSYGFSSRSHANKTRVKHGGADASGCSV